jgi:hypothetical protein
MLCPATKCYCHFCSIADLSKDRCGSCGGRIPVWLGGTGPEAFFVLVAVWGSGGQQDAPNAVLDVPAHDALRQPAAGPASLPQTQWQVRYLNRCHAIRGRAVMGLAIPHQGLRTAMIFTTAVLRSGNFPSVSGASPV